MSNQVCAVCSHNQIDSINREIAEGSAIAVVARNYTLPYHCVYHHSLHHMPKNPSREHMQQRKDALADIALKKSQLDEMLTDDCRKKHPITALKIMAESRALSEQELRITSTNMQARIQELEEELNALRSGLNDDQDNTDWSVFTDSELKEIIRLGNKLNGEHRPRMGRLNGYRVNNDGLVN